MNTLTGKLQLIFNIILTIFDVTSDVLLAVDYYVMDNPWWCILTAAAFISLPLITGVVFLLVYCYLTPSEKLSGKSVWNVWKGIEICFESGPQVILQLYILALEDLDPRSFRGKSSFHDINALKPLFQVKNTKSFG